MLSSGNYDVCVKSIGCHHYQSTDGRPISRPILGRDSADISTDVNRHACWPTPGRYFTVSRPTVGRYFTDIWRIMCIYIDRVSVDTIGRYVARQSADISTETRPIYRPKLRRHIDRHQPVCDGRK